MTNKIPLMELTRQKLFCLLFILLCGAANAQTFTPQDITKLPKGLSHKAYIAEINNDAHKDIIYLIEVEKDSVVAFLFLQTSPLEFQLTDTLTGLSSTNIFFTDINKSGQLDLIVREQSDTGSVVYALLNDHAAFQKKELHGADSIFQFQIEDMNNDGWKDLCIIEKKGGQKSFSIYLNEQDTAFDINFSLPGVSDFIITSLDGDGFKDLALYDESNSRITFHRNRKSETWQTVDSLYSQRPLHWVLSDIDHNGRADLLIAMPQDSVTQILSVMDTSGIKVALPLHTFPGSIEFLTAADFTNDGLYDILISSPEKSLIVPLDSSGAPLPTFLLDSLESFSTDAIGDINDDGLLDWLGFIDDQDSVILRLLVNDHPEPNTGPFFVMIAAPKTIEEYTTFSWHMAWDDKTPFQSLTYDFYIESIDEGTYIITSDHDLVNSPALGARNISRQGYTLFDTVYVVKDLQVGRYHWGVAGVDNAFYSQTDITNCIGGGPCSNEAFVNQCLEIFRDETFSCRFDTLTLQFGDVGDSVTWSSARKGEIGYGNTLRFPVIGDDVVYAVAFPKTPCDDPANACMKNFSLTVETIADSSDFALEPVLICPDSTFTYELPGEYEEVIWFTTSGILSETNAVQFNPFIDSPLIVKIKEAGNTCYHYDTLVVNMLEKPDVNFFPTEEDSVCQNSSYTIEITLPDHLRDSITYSLFSNGALVDISNPEIAITQPTTLVVSAQYAGCFPLYDTLALNVIALPTISVEGNQQLFAGQSTLLTASGARDYEWSPAQSLSSPHAASTSASPTVSTTYTVTGWNEQGCEGQAPYSVEIIPTVHIPELFTPNDDGNNDRLIVHGREIRSINFSLFDGNGRKIYTTSSIPEITFNGWDGKVNGKTAAPGTYIWTVEGQFTNGTPVTFNGKNKGELKIIR